MDLAAFKIRNRVRSLMLAAYRGGPTKPVAEAGRTSRRAPSLSALVNNVHFLGEPR
jgi:hypothetical protein